jgi:hypothetical protein
VIERERKRTPRASAWLNAPRAGEMHAWNMHYKWFAEIQFVALREHDLLFGV